jgi:hypothetical protein
MRRGGGRVPSFHWVTLSHFPPASFYHSAVRRVAKPTGGSSFRRRRVGPSPISWQPAPRRLASGRRDPTS